MGDELLGRARAREVAAIAALQTADRTERLELEAKLRDARTEIAVLESAPKDVMRRTICFARDRAIQLELKRSAEAQASFAAKKAAPEERETRTPGVLSLETLSDELLDGARKRADKLRGLVAVARKERTDEHRTAADDRASLEAKLQYAMDEIALLSGASRGALEARDAAVAHEHAVEDHLRATGAAIAPLRSCSRGRRPHSCKKSTEAVLVHGSDRVGAPQAPGRRRGSSPPRERPAPRSATTPRGHDPRSGARPVCDGGSVRGSG